MDRSDCERYFDKAVHAMEDALDALSKVDVDKDHTLYTPIEDALQSIEVFVAVMKRWKKILHDEEIALEE